MINRTAAKPLDQRRIASALAPSILLAVAMIVTIGATIVTQRGQPQLIVTAGPVVDYGLPILKMLLNLASAGTLGALVLACFAIRPQTPAHNTALDIAAGCAAAWAVAAAGCVVLVFLSIVGPLSGDAFTMVFGQFLTSIELGQAWLATLLLTGIIAVLCFAVRSPTGIMAITILAFLTLVPLALQGHAAGGGSHGAASSALWLHVASAATWTGGLTVVLAIHRTVSRVVLFTTVSRYSSIALVCFVTVAVSGTITAVLQLEYPQQLVTTVYGLLLSIKILALGLLGLAGFGHRRWLLGRLSDASRPRWLVIFWWLVVSELVLMGIAFAAATVLARTPPPTAEQIADTPAERLTGLPLPGPFTLPRALDSWSVDPVWLLVAAFGIVAYLIGVYRLRKREQLWPAWRTVSWTIGLVILLYVTNGAPNAYGPYLLSAHALGHLVLALTVPLLLVLGAPVNLLLRAVSTRDDGSRGIREWIIVAGNSRANRVLEHPLVALVLFAASLVLFYSTPVFAWALDDPIGQLWMSAQFLIVGLLLVRSIVGVPNGTARVQLALRFLTVLALMAFYAVWGLTFATSAELLVPDWYGTITSGWPIDPLTDQHSVGPIIWAVGGISTIALTATAALAWARDLAATADADSGNTTRSRRGHR